MAGPTNGEPLRVRWLGRVPYREALALQTGLFESGTEQHLLLLEHPHVFTHGMRADLVHNLKCEPAAVGAELVPVKRGGDITYHGPGQLVGYPILNVDNRLGAAAHVCGVEGLLIDALARARPAERGPARGLCRRVARRRPSRPGRRTAQDRRDRRAPARGPHDARIRPERHHRPHLHARPHRAVRHRRPARHVARRGRCRRHDARGGRRRGPPRCCPLGRRRDRAAGRGLAPSGRRP